MEQTNKCRKTSKHVKNMEAWNAYGTCGQWENYGALLKRYGKHGCFSMLLLFSTCFHVVHCFPDFPKLPCCLHFPVFTYLPLVGSFLRIMLNPYVHEQLHQESGLWPATVRLDTGILHHWYDCFQTLSLRKQKPPTNIKSCGTLKSTRMKTLVA